MRIALRGTGVAALVTAGLVAGGCKLERLNGTGGNAAVEPDLAVRVQSLLDEQVAAWNAGDLDGFMRGYHRSFSTTYLGSTGLIEGYDAIRARYAPAFAPDAARDSLRVEALRVREVDARVGLATARYVLEDEGAATATGQFTLVLLNVEGAWLIVHDQSAADPED